MLKIYLIGCATSLLTMGYMFFGLDFKNGRNKEQIGKFSQQSNFNVFRLIALASLFSWLTVTVSLPIFIIEILERLAILLGGDE